MLSHIDCINWRQQHCIFWNIFLKCWYDCKYLYISYGVLMLKMWLSQKLFIETQNVIKKNMFLVIKKICNENSIIFHFEKHPKAMSTYRYGIYTEQIKYPYSFRCEIVITVIMTVGPFYSILGNIIKALLSAIVLIQD